MKIFFKKKEWNIWEIQKACWNINDGLNFHLQERICQISMTIETLSTNNFISPRPSFWKMLTSIDFLEQVVAILDLSTWWKHSVKNSQCKNDVLLNELVGKCKEWILQKNKPQLHHYQQSLSILEHTQAYFKNSDINHNFSTGRKNTCYPPLLKVLPQWQQFWEGNCSWKYLPTKSHRGECIERWQPLNCLILIRGREEGISVG